MKKGIANIILFLMKITFIDRIIEYYLLKGIVRNSKKVSKNIDKPRLFWGPIPILNNKYFSNLMGEAGFESRTVMENYFDNINVKSDFDIYINELSLQGKTPFFLYIRFKDLYFFRYVVSNFDIFFISYRGGVLRNSKFKNQEAQLLHKMGKKIVMLPYGSDVYSYQDIIDPSLHHVLLKSYPKYAENSSEIRNKVSYWQKHADCVLGSIFIDGVTRWDLLPVNFLTIDTRHWQKKEIYSENNGSNGPVKIIHTPNHRGFKGTEFIIQSVKELQEEGVNVELILIENMKNEEVRRIMFEEADILIEQLIFSGYALSGLEGMATGIPVMSNLTNPNYTELVRRYSYLNECPIVGSNPENIKENLKVLVKNPELRKTLGTLGRSYVEKYHSNETGEYMFTKIINKIWFGHDVNLIDMFHPLHKESYNNQSPKIEHPLANNSIPKEYFKN
jgi:hypothetical protein